MAKDRYGCAAHRQRGTCGNDRTILRQEIESRVLSGLKERLLAPELFAEFARTYQEEVTTAAREQGAAHERGARALADCDKRIAGVIAATRTGSTARRSKLASLRSRPSGRGLLLHLRPPPLPRRSRYTRTCPRCTGARWSGSRRR